MFDKLKVNLVLLILTVTAGLKNRNSFQSLFSHIKNRRSTLMYFFSKLRSICLVQ